MTNGCVRCEKAPAIPRIYFQNKIVDARIEERKGKKYVIANISTSNREELIIVEEGAMKKQKKEPEPIPFTLEPNEAVIKYMVGKKIYYYKVSKIKKRDTVFYQ